MKILALETSAKAVSAAVSEDGKILCYGYQDTGLTHSRTLMPIVEHILKNTGLTVADMDAIAVAAGPGSFTGIRIGVAAAKGLAFAADKPAVGVSTLAAMARNVAFCDGLVICAMDARRQQVYNALFEAKDGQLTRLTPDRAIALEDLVAELKGTQTTQLVVGDGAQLCCNALTAAGIPARIAPPNLRTQSAWGVARLALEQARAGQLLTPNQLVPVYHRLSQAERERLEREQAAKRET